MNLSRSLFWNCLLCPTKTRMNITSKYTWSLVLTFDNEIRFWRFDIYCVVSCTTPFFWPSSLLTVQISLSSYFNTNMITSLTAMVNSSIICLKFELAPTLLWAQALFIQTQKMVMLSSQRYKVVVLFHCFHNLLEEDCITTQWIT